MICEQIFHLHLGYLHILVSHHHIYKLQPFHEDFTSDLLCIFQQGVSNKTHFLGMESVDFS
jgi:hypothetical protein